VAQVVVKAAAQYQVQTVQILSLQRLLAQAGEVVLPIRLLGILAVLAAVVLHKVLVLPEVVLHQPVKVARGDLVGVQVQGQP
jgi:hypothetical protein